MLTAVKCQSYHAKSRCNSVGHVLLLAAQSAFRCLGDEDPQTTCHNDLRRIRNKIKNSLSVCSHLATYPRVWCATKASWEEIIRTHVPCHSLAERKLFKRLPEVGSTRIILAPFYDHHWIIIIEWLISLLARLWLSYFAIRKATRISRGQGALSISKLAKPCGCQPWNVRRPIIAQGSGVHLYVQYPLCDTLVSRDLVLPLRHVTVVAHPPSRILA